MNRAHLFVAAGVVAATLNLGSQGAFANNFSVSTCVDGKASVSVNVSLYGEHAPNHMTVIVAGVTVADTNFSNEFSATFQTVNGAAWKVDLSTSDHREEQHRSGTITCGPVTTTTVPATTTTVPATTTTTPSTTTPAATTVPVVTVAPTVPPRPPQVHVTPVLPATGFWTKAAIGFGIWLLILGVFLVGISNNKRLEASELRGFGETER